MKSIARRFLVRNDNQLGECINYLRELPLARIAVLEVVIREERKRHSEQQRRTLWMWHGEVAAWLSVHTPHLWDKDDVHEHVFKLKFMPREEYNLGGNDKFVNRSRGLSDPDTSRADVAEAMLRYQVWAQELGIEITIPEPDGTW